MTPLSSSWSSMRHLDSALSAESAVATRSRSTPTASAAAAAAAALAAWWAPTSRMLTSTRICAATSVNAGRHEVGQLRDVAPPASPHLDDQVAGARVGAQHRHRHAQLVVERAARGDGGALGGEDGGEHVLGRGLALRAGQRDDREVPRL